MEEPDAPAAAAAAGDRPALVSACLLGRACRYDGSHNDDRELAGELAAQGLRAVPFCPEEHGGLPTPRPPAWIEAHDAGAVLEGRARVRTDAGAVLEGRARVRTEAGTDATAAFLAGARGALELCRREGITRAFLKERSPSCGVGATHVGGRAVPGPGVTAELLRRHGVELRGVEGRRG